jgi:hypothetical protein
MSTALLLAPAFRRRQHRGKRQGPAAPCS